MIKRHFSQKAMIFGILSISKQNKKVVEEECLLLLVRSSKINRIFAGVFRCVKIVITRAEKYLSQDLKKYWHLSRMSFNHDNECINLSSITLCSCTIDSRTDRRRRGDGSLLWSRWHDITVMEPEIFKGRRRHRRRPPPHHGPERRILWRNLPSLPMLHIWI